MENFPAAPVGIALVTGASRGLGRVMALRFAAAGYAVAVNYRQAVDEADAVVREIERGGGQALPFRADMSSTDDASSLVERVERELGPIQVLISNAGITRDRLLIQMTETDWDATWLTDYSGPRSLCRHAIARMAERRAGRVITISSVVGVTGNAGQANYAAAKSALQGMTRELAVQAAPSGVTVNCIIPGYFATDATSHLSEAQREVWCRRIPMARAGSPEDIANLALFLAGRGAGYITGQCIAVDGGLLARAGGGLAS